MNQDSSGIYFGNFSTGTAPIMYPNKTKTQHIFLLFQKQLHVLAKVNSHL